MTLAALAVGGVAWLGAVAAVVAGGGRFALGLRRLGGSTIAGLGVACALAASPLLLLVAPADLAIDSPDGAAVDRTIQLVIAVAGLAASLLAGLIVTDRGTEHAPSSSGHDGRAVPFGGGLGGLAIACAGAAATLAGAGTAAGHDLAPASAIALGAGLGIVVTAVPMATLGRGRARPVGVAVLVAGVGLVDRAIGPWSPLIALVGPVLGVAAASLLAVGVRRPIDSRRTIASGTAGVVRPANSTWAIAPSRFDTPAVAFAVVGAPSLVGLGSIVLLLTGPSGDADAGAGVRLAISGGMGLALLALAELVRGQERPALTLLPVAASIPVAALALRLDDPVAAILLAGIAGAIALFGPGREPQATRRGPGAALAATILPLALVGGVLLASAGSATAPAAAGVAGLGTFLAAAAIGGSIGVLPFHRLATLRADLVPAFAIGPVLGWLPAVGSLVGIEALAAVAAPALGGLERPLVEIAAVATIGLGGIAACVQDDVRHAFAYLVVSAAGWIVLGLASPVSPGQPAVAWLPSFAAGALALGGAASLLDARSTTGRLPDLSGFGRRNPVIVLALGAAFVASVGLPGTSSWASRAAIADDAIGGVPAAALLTFGAAIAAVGFGRFVMDGLRPPRGVVSSWPPFRDRGRTNVGSVVESGAIALVSVLAIVVSVAPPA
ncbi:MAG TPA: proton-conducting transporter membrane subunit [Candidatus Limnocylindrales bacterium]|nr:proton-conducting transporter membrane subunit [Candidatus Limnocylindrales bacterium]